MFYFNQVLTSNPQATKGDCYTCPEKYGSVSHVGEPITRGYDSVKINGVPR